MTDPTEISDSQLKEFQRCERRWAFKRLLKLEPSEGKDNLIYGNSLHEGMEEFVKTSDLAKSQTVVIEYIKKERPEDFQWQLQVAPAQLYGWAVHWLPAFLKDHDITAVEQWFDVLPHPAVKIRGYKDLQAKRKTTGGRVLLDYKTSGQSGGGDLGKTVSINQQLAIYAVDDRRRTGDWPHAVGLVFLQKPKNNTIDACVKAAKEKADLYFDRMVEVTPAFAAFALDVERSFVSYALRMGQYRTQFVAQGPAFIDSIPPNFNECFSYGEMCGFAAGCHSGQPCHRLLPRKP